MLKALAVAGGPLVRGLASSSSSSPICATKIVLRAIPPSTPNLKALEVEFNNGDRYIYSAEFLRVKSPAADSQRRSARGTIRAVAGRRHIAIISVEPTGNYAIRISFDDLHDTGIYTWSYLHSLGKNKFQLMREYLKTLKEQSLSRDLATKTKNRT
ncbi:uncharacterized protein [Physcomitrium patens]|uniref:Gamma-butyrobetaine hydroxylase-like N-terminal domain-containing protein n=1 Tax=Physcomitrium patens TaxID=3218 RepID=A0A2K1JU72_PHYPA|nr:uncharacterized protein LOC112288742 isoform X1 [Physcomitrium patens]PNR45077.1 hypothetical protein PHYPA_014848 [Physcomitrium patens]|eukprot:XP_024389037.1 uncharacterized protein LOC112288742 isoform X1 [Physcomitrella patens]